MKIYIIKKIKNRLYKSENIMDAVLKAMGFGDRVHFAYGDGGRPLLECEGADLFVSVSHTKNYWVCAISGSPVGIDIEESSRTVHEKVSGRLHKREKEYLSALEPSSRQWKEEFLNIWTRKEAYLKLTGKGLRQPLNSFSVLDDTLSYIDDGYRACRAGGLLLAAAFEPGERTPECDRMLDIENFEYEAPMEMPAMEAAAELLEHYSYTSSGLLRKLTEKGYDELSAKEAACRLQSLGYIDDDYLAGRLAEKLAAQNKASARIRSELIKKGISPELAKTVSDAYKEGDYDRAMKEYEKLSAQFKPGDSDKNKAKLLRRLAYLGYDSSVAYDIAGLL